MEILMFIYTATMHKTIHCSKLKIMAFLVLKWEKYIKTLCGTLQ